MQYISVLCGEPFSTRPRAVEPTIAVWCWRINDLCPSDALRADLLVPLVPRLMRTHRLPPERASWIAAQHAAARQDEAAAARGCRRSWEGMEARARHLTVRLVQVLDELEPELLDHPELLDLPDAWSEVDERAALTAMLVARMSELRAQMAGLVVSVGGGAAAASGGPEPDGGVPAGLVPAR